MKGPPLHHQLRRADRFMWGSDYPHTEGEAGALDELMENIASLPEDNPGPCLGR